MIERIKQQAARMLEDGSDGVLGLRKKWGQVGPYLFKSAAELDQIEVEPKYSLTKTLKLMLKRRPDMKIAAVVRGCDVRAFLELKEKHGLNIDGLNFIGIECSLDQAKACNCEKPVYDTFKCTGCWECLNACEQDAIERINVCPVLVPSEYDVELRPRKAVYIPYAQAVPLKATRDTNSCLALKGELECKGCSNVCQAEAITDNDQEKTYEIDAGSIVFAPGFKPYDPSGLDFYGYDRSANIVTSMQFERILSASGPYGGHLVRPSDHKEPARIAWLQCVGSRDINRCDNAYCSSVCCMYAVKEAVIAKEHADYDLECSVFYMDMRTPGKEFERFYEKAKTQGVNFVRSRIHSIDTINGSDDLNLRYVNEDGQISNEVYDMVVLSIGLEISKETMALAEQFGIDLTQGSFADTSSFDPAVSSRDGVFVCGAIQGPRDIPQSVVDSSAAAAKAGALLSSSRNTLNKVPETIPETNVVGDRPRIGVFVCNCGTNIAGTVNVPEVRDYAATLPYVEYYADNLYSCSQDTQDAMTKVIKEKNLNRVVVAACTPKTHEPLFQETLTNAGLNKYLFEMTNIRNHASWVHKQTPELATQKAKDLVRMAVSKVALTEPLKEAELNVNQVAMVIGGGLSGMSSAKNLAEQGYEVHLIEKENQLGGQANNLFQTYKHESIAAAVANLTKEVNSSKNINVHLETTLENVEGFVGNFKSSLACNGSRSELEHGVAVIATGAKGYVPDEYCYGQNDSILTSLELDRKLIDNDPALKKTNSAVFIQCVGSRQEDRPYCSRVCCTHSIDNALELKKLNPEMDVYILYRDIRTYGEREYIYQKARQAGIIFIRYSLDEKPVVEVVDNKVLVTVKDHVLGVPVQIETDILTLATAIVPNRDEKLANFFKVPLNDDGFFVEKHAKLGPSEFATDGVFLCGLAHYPKPIEESIAHGQAAASRAVTLLAREVVHTSGNVASVNQMICSSCGVCVSICPYSAPSFEAEGRFAGKAAINPVLCKGCGLCVASCRSSAIRLKGFDTNQILSQIFALDEAV